MQVRLRYKGVKRLRGGDFEYRLYCKGEETKYCAVGLMVKQELVQFMMKARRVSSRILSRDLVLHDTVMTINLVYASQHGRRRESSIIILMLKCNIELLSVSVLHCEI